MVILDEIELEMTILERFKVAPIVKKMVKIRFLSGLFISRERFKVTSIEL